MAESIVSWQIITYAAECSTKQNAETAYTLGLAIKALKYI